MKNLLRASFIVLFLGQSISVLAVKNIKKVSKLQSALTDHDFVLAHFYMKGDKKKSPSLYNYNQHMEYLLEEIEEGYEDIIKCIKLPQEKAEIKNTARSKYGLQDNHGLVLFKYGKKHAVLSISDPEAMTQAQISDFIDDNLKKEIEEKIKKLEEDRRYAKRNRSSVSFGFGYDPYYSYGWNSRPYWWRHRYYYPYGGSFLGFPFGRYHGGGHHHGRGKHRSKRSFSGGGKGRRGGGRGGRRGGGIGKHHRGRARNR